MYRCLVLLSGLTCPLCHRVFHIEERSNDRINESKIASKSDSKHILPYELGHTKIYKFIYLLGSLTNALYHRGAGNICFQFK